MEVEWVADTGTTVGAWDEMKQPYLCSSVTIQPARLEGITF